MCGHRQGEADEKLGHGRAVRCLRAPMTAVNRLEILMLLHKFEINKKTSQTGGHSCRSPLGPSLARSKRSWRLREGQEPPLGICCRWGNNTLFLAKIP